MLLDKLKFILIPLYLLLWLMLSLYLGQHHEPFADEAQSYLIARDATLYELFSSVLRKEGHPFLWYLWLKFLLSLGLPYGKIYLASLIPEFAGVALFVYKAPFRLWARLAFVSTYFIFYQYNIVARSYSLALFFIVLTALAWQKRVAHPLRYTFALIGLGSISAHTFLLSAGLFALTMYEHKATKSSLALFALFVLISIALVLPDMQNSYCQHIVKNNYIIKIRAINSVSTGLIMSQQLSKENIGLSGIGIFYFTLLMAELIGLYKKEFIFLLLPNLFFTAMFFKPWHAGIIILTIMLILWQNSAKKINKTFICYIILFFIVQIYWSIIAFYKDKNDAYSAAPAVYAFLEQKNISLNEILYLSFNTTSLCPYDTTKSCSYWDWRKYGFIKKTNLATLPTQTRAVITTAQIKKQDEILTNQGFIVKKFPSQHFFATKDMSKDETMYVYYLEAADD